MLVFNLCEFTRWRVVLVFDGCRATCLGLVLWSKRFNLLAVHRFRNERSGGSVLNHSLALRARIQLVRIHSLARRACIRWLPSHLSWLGALEQTFQFARGPQIPERVFRGERIEPLAGASCLYSICANSLAGASCSYSMVAEPLVWGSCFGCVPTWKDRLNSILARAILFSPRPARVAILPLKMVPGRFSFSSFVVSGTSLYPWHDD